MAGIASWNGSTWAALGSGIPGPFTWVRELTTFDTGSGAVLVAGGRFDIAGGLPAKNVAQWNGSTWSALGSGVQGEVYAMGTFDDGGGEALYVGGFITQAGGAPVNNIAKWNGTAWSALGAGIPIITQAPVKSLKAFDDGSGPALYVGGFFLTAGGISTGMNHIARWHGAAWSSVGGGVGPPFSGSEQPVQAMAVWEESGTQKLLAAGTLSGGSGQSIAGVALWDGDTWSPMITKGGVSSQVFAIAAIDDGAGGKQLVCGSPSGGVALAPAVRDASGDWSTLGDGLISGVTLNSVVYRFLVHDDGAGEVLYAAGSFGVTGSPGGWGVAKWNGTAWSAVGSGMQPLDFGGYVRTLCFYDDGLGAGPVLYAGGLFEKTAAGTVVNGIARWNGTAWLPVGGGVLRASGDQGWVHDLQVFDDGTGSALYVAGSFIEAGGVEAINLARWNGTAWSAVGGTISIPDATLDSLAVYDDGSGPKLLAGAGFVLIGGKPVGGIVQWDGLSWTVLDPNVDVAAKDMLVYNENGRSFLFVGGSHFTIPSSLPNRAVARWDGKSWSTFAGGVTWSPSGNAHVHSLAIIEEDDGPALYVGGPYFYQADGLLSPYLAKWSCATFEPVPADLNGDGVVDAVDISILLAAWGQCPARGPCPEDLDDNGIVNGFDLAILLGQWG